MKSSPEFDCPNNPDSNAAVCALGEKTRVSPKRSQRRNEAKLPRTTEKCRYMY